jgi:undecaprenyl-diphosphatase
MWKILSVFGNVLFWIGIGFASLVFSFIAPKKIKKKIMSLSFLILSVVIISSVLVHGMKILFKVPRPCLGLSNCPESYSFPSGHAAVIFAVVTILVSHRRNKYFGLFLLSFATLVAVSRLMLNVHRSEDIIIGSLIGIVISISFRKASKFVIER